MSAKPTTSEIERKFLVASDAWRHDASSPTQLKQGYLSTDPKRSVRIRIEGDVGRLTIKGEKTGAKGLEFEYPIPLAHAKELLERLALPHVIEKRRFRVEYEGFTWEVDEFLGANAGLIVAEVELQDQADDPKRPPWVGTDVTHDSRYSNARLSEVPFNEWPDPR